MCSAISTVKHERQTNVNPLSSSAFTGQVPKFHEPGKLRLIWWTTEDAEGMKDYELHQYMMVRENFDVLLALPEVRRVVVMGYSGQNPYVMGDRGTNPWAEKFGRDWARVQKESRRGGAADVRQTKTVEKEVDVDEVTKERMDASKEARVGKAVNMEDIEQLIEDNDRAEEEARRERAEKIAEENEGLLNGEMV